MSSASAAPLPDLSAAGRIHRVTVSGALDEAIRILHENPRDLMLIAALLTALPLWGYFYFGLQPVLALLDAWFMFAGERVPIDFRPFLMRILSVTLPWLIATYFICQPIALGALVLLSAGILTGHRTTPGEAIRASLRSGIALTWMWLLRMVCVQLGSMMCYVPGIMLAAIWLCAVPAVMLEGLGPIQALSRSYQLNKPRLGEAVLLVLLLGLIEWLTTQYGQLFPAGWPQAIGISLLSAAMLVLYAAGITVFYFSGRCQSENYDLQLWVQSLARRDELNASPDQSTLFTPLTTG
ncbi:MAG: hypothetical protein U0992_22175 [Planctomycetaceae bacterium]